MKVLKVILILLLLLYSVFISYGAYSLNEKSLTLQRNLGEKALKYESLESRYNEMNDLLKEANKQLGLIFTLKETGLRINSLDDLKKLIYLASNLPIGSPFQEPFLVTSPFGARDESFLGGGDDVHYGIDIIPKSRKAHAPIYSTASGEIIEFGISDVYGKYILFRTDHGYIMKYAHLSKIFYQNSDGKVKGVKIPKGKKLALMGKTGKAFGFHLHYEIRMYDEVLGDYRQLDPSEILKFIKEP